MIWEETRLEGLRRRVRTVTRLGRLRGGLVAVAAGTIAGAGSYLAASALDVSLWLPAWTRVMALAATIALVAYAALRWGVRSTRELGREGEAARAVERRYPEIENTLSTSIEFGSDARKTEAYSSPEIVDTLVEVTSARTEPLSFPSAVDWRLLARAAGIAAVLAAVIFVYAAALPHLARATAKRLFAPLGGTPPPTWTVIEKIAPGSVEVRRGSSQRIEVEVGGRRPESVRLRYRARSVAEGELAWSDVEMSPLAAKSFTRTLVNITRPIEYRVSAGDAMSPTHVLTPFEEPRVESLGLRITPPAYTGLPAEDLPEGTGDVRAIIGTEVEVRARVSEKTREARLDLTLGDRGGEKGRQARSLELEPTPGNERDRRARFTLTGDGEYRIHLTDDRGRTNRSEENAVFRLTAVPDRAPKVRVSSPRPDVLAARDQDVTVEIEASDDWGLAEIGIVHTLSGKPERVAVGRPAPGTKKSNPSHKIRLGLFGFKGGEIVTYHAYARDNNDVTGPSEAEGELRFIRTYGEERYGIPMGEMRTPPAAREVDRLIDRQMDVMRETFDLARRERAPAPRVTKDAAAPRGVNEAASAQDDVRRDLDDLLRAIETRLDRELAGGVMPQEIVLLREAEKKMGEATDRLHDGKPSAATAPQAEALSLLSRTRRIILSQSGSGGVGRAMEDARRERRSHRQSERRRDLDELERQMRKMPPVLEREREQKRRLERLEDEPPPPGQAAQSAEEQRRLAESARDQARALSRAGAGDASFPREPQRKLLEAADEMERSADAAEQRDFGRAARDAERAAREVAAAESAARAALHSADRERTKGAQGQAEEIARRQKDLAKRTAERTRRESEDKEAGPSAAEAASLAREQEELRKEIEELGEEVRSLAGRAEREGKAEAEDLRFAGTRGQIAEDEMDRAARALRGSRPFEAQLAQREAAEEVGKMAKDLRDAVHRADSAERRELGRAVARAERLAEEAAELSREVREPARDPQGLEGEAARLQEEAAGLARDVSRIPSRAGKGDIGKAKESLERAERELGRAGRAMGRPDRAGAVRSSEAARREAEHAASALRRSAAADVARALSDARAEARQGARKQKEVREALAALARQEDGRTDETADPSKVLEGAARDEERAARAERGARDNVESAAETARELGADVARLLEREAARAGRELLDERMDAFGSKLEKSAEEAATGAGHKVAAAEENLCQADRFVRETAAAAERLNSLFAEARDDEIETLRALAEDSRRLAGELQSLGELVARAAEERPESADARPPEDARDEDVSGRESRDLKGRDREQAGLTLESKDLAARVRGLEDDAKGLRERLERRAPELLSEMLKERTGEAELRDVFTSTERELLELGRRLSRNQRPRPTNRLGAGALAYQLVAGGVIEKLERIVKQREFRPPADEIAPEEFRDLVEKYFRALSEDSGD